MKLPCRNTLSGRMVEFPEPPARITAKEIMASTMPAKMVADFLRAATEYGGADHASRELAAVLVDLAYHVRPELTAE